MAFVDQFAAFAIPSSMLLGNACAAAEQPDEGEDNGEVRSSPLSDEKTNGVFGTDVPSGESGGRKCDRADRRICAVGEAGMTVHRSTSVASFTSSESLNRPHLLENLQKNELWNL